METTRQQYTILGGVPAPAGPAPAILQQPHRGGSAAAEVPSSAAGASLAAGRATAGRPPTVNLLDLASGSYAMGWQLFLAYRRTQPLGGGELALLAARIALLTGAMLIAGLAPGSWLKIRVGGLTVVRVGYLLLGGVAATGPPMALHHPATPGWTGLLHDWMRLLLGVRILHVATMGTVLQQPVLVTAAQQAVVLLASDVGGYCRSPLLSDTLMQRRMARLESWLSTLLAGPLGVPLSGMSQELASTGSDPHNICVSVLTFLNITLALLLPVLLVVGRAASAPPAEESRVPQQQQQQHGVVGAAKRAASKAGETWAAADAQLAALCSSTQELPWPHQMLLARSLLSLAWVLSITVGLFHRP